MDEKYFYEHLHEFMMQLERDSVFPVKTKAEAMLEARDTMRKMFPNAEVVMNDDPQSWTRDEQISVNMKEIHISDTDAFLDAVRKADYIEFIPGCFHRMQLVLGFKKIKVTKEELLNEEV